MRGPLQFLLPALFGALATGPAAQPEITQPNALTPGTRVLLDAHNAYPYQGRWADRLERALATGLPITIEQDLVWHQGRSMVSHGEPFTGKEPTLDQYFFERIRPHIEQALRENRRRAWPIITLNLDLKTNEPEHHRAVWDVLGRYERWLTTAARTENAAQIAPLTAGPLLVLTGDSPEQEVFFHDRVPVGGRLRLFGAVLPDAPGKPEKTNYRRWSNNPWKVVEPEGQPLAGNWTPDDEGRLTAAVRAAHDAGLWIRFYTLNGHDTGDESHGWSESYNLGSLAAARIRWQAAIRAGVDFIATDQYEELARCFPTACPITIQGTLTHADYEAILERTFDLPRGTRRITAEIEYNDAQRTVIDLGLQGPAGFRGWSGGGRQRISAGEHSASFGYTAGPLEDGSWKVLLGVPNIRPGVSTAYTLTIAFDDRSDRPVLSRAARWYAGDLHAHSGHSDGRTIDASGTRLKVPPEHVFAAARRAGLDFVALTDHNTAAHWADIERLQPLYPGLLLMRGREVTTYRGHMNAFGERRLVDFRIGPARPVATIASELSEAGAVVSINHPLRPDDETCMGCGWNDRDRETVGAVQAIEVVNGDRGGDEDAWGFWAAMLTRGHRLTAIGGSDEHTPDETVDRGLGRPTTVIFARELSEAAILDGIRSGHVYIRTRGAAGPTLEFEARGHGAPVQMGGELEAGRTQLTATVTGADGQTLEWIRNGDVVSTAKLGGRRELAHDVDARPDDWFAVILRDARGPTVYSNAIYVR